MNRLRLLTQAILFNAMMINRLSSPFAAADDEDAREYHECGEEFLPCKDVHTDDDAYDGSDDRLDIAVHADKGRTDTLLSVWDKEIGHECGEHDQIPQLPHLF